MTDTKALKQSDLRQFSGSEHWYRHALVRKVVYTDGAKYVTARLVCGDGNGHAVHTQEIPFTDFPLAEIKFYFVNNTILLPSEY